MKMIQQAMFSQVVQWDRGLNKHPLDQTSEDAIKEVKVLISQNTFYSDSFITRILQLENM